MANQPAAENTQGAVSAPKQSKKKAPAKKAAKKSAPKVSPPALEPETDGVVTGQHDDGSLDVQMNDGEQAFVPAAAAAPQDIPNMDRVKLDALVPGSPQWHLKRKLIKEEQLRKKNARVVHEWLEYHHTNAHKKGGKCLHKKRMANGTVHSFYLGRLNKGGLGMLQAFVKKGLKIWIGAEHLGKLIPEIAVKNPPRPE
jgi:hypothetical protein